MKYILIKFSDVHCVILEDDKGEQCICPTKVDAIRLQAKNKDYVIVPMVNIMLLVDEVNISTKGLDDYCTYDNAKVTMLRIKDIFSEI